MPEVTADEPKVTVSPDEAVHVTRKTPRRDRAAKVIAAATVAAFVAYGIREWRRRS